MSQNNKNAPKKDGETKGAADKNNKKKNEKDVSPEEDLVSLTSLSIFTWPLTHSFFNSKSLN